MALEQPGEVAISELRALIRIEYQGHAVVPDRFLDGLDTRLEAGQTVSLVPAVAGG